MPTTLTSPTTISTVLSVGQGPAGPAGLRRHDFVAPGTSYCATAPDGFADTDEAWTIQRITVAPDGTTVVATASNVRWTDRLTAIYS